MVRRLPSATLFPYTTLFRSQRVVGGQGAGVDAGDRGDRGLDHAVDNDVAQQAVGDVLDRKSTRLNSSHGASSYDVFGLQRKTREAGRRQTRDQGHRRRGPGM